MSYTLPQLITRAAATHPDKPAFRCLGKQVTYRELERQMHQIAGVLKGVGVKKGDRVGIFMARSLETAAAIYGIMAAGAIYVPLNPGQPVSRTYFLLKDCGIEVLLTNDGQKRNLPAVITAESGVKTVLGTTTDLPCQTMSWTEIYAQDDNPPAVNILESDPAYLLCTSGSTGVPKGILHTHRSGLAYAELSVADYNLCENDVLGNHAPIYFDISTLGYFAGPMARATTIIASEAHVKMPASLAQLLEKEQITVWYSVPLALMQMQQSGKLSALDLKKLRWVIFAGEVYPMKHLRRLVNELPQAKFSNAYGPTETNVCTIYNFSELPENMTSLPVGKVRGNTEILLLQDGKPAESGELLVRSPTLMQGYRNRPDLNEKAFYKRPTAAGGTEIFYRTGDLMRRDADGNLLFLGRKDRQVKVRGFRVELDEITETLLRHPQVTAAAVYTRTTADENTEIAATVTTSDPENLTEADLILYLKKELPPYAVPANIRFVKEMPRTATGKIDLKALQNRMQTA